MLKRTLQLVTLLFFVVCALTDTVMGQARRSRPQRTRPTSQKPEPPKTQPLTLSQKAAIKQVLEKANEAEPVYNYQPGEFERFATNLLDDAEKTGASLPEGNVRSLLIVMGRTFDDARVIHGRIINSERDKTLRRTGEFIRNMGGEEADPVILVVKKYGLERATPYQAFNFIFSTAIKYRGLLQAALDAAPTVAEQPTSIPAGTSKTTTQDSSNELFKSQEASKPSPEANNVSPVIDLVGTWELLIQGADGNSTTMLLTVRQNGDSLGGEILAKGQNLQFDKITVSGNSFSASASETVNGQKSVMAVSGSIRDGAIKGVTTLTLPTGASLTVPFTGTQKSRESVIK